jgi:hypothetical protein
MPTRDQEGASLDRLEGQHAVGSNAVIFIQVATVVATTKQTTACLRYVSSQNYVLKGFVQAGGTGRDAVRMVRDGLAEIVVVAFGGKDIAGEVEAAGGRVEAVHPSPPHVVHPPPPPRHQPIRGVGDLLRRIKRGTGMSTDELARMLGEDTTDVRKALRERSRQAGDGPEPDDELR